MEINQLKTIYEIVKTGSYSKASRNMFVTQSAVSHQVKNLEKELNVRLFERLGNRMRITEEGEILAEAIRKVLDDLENLKKISENLRHVKTGHLTIATINGIMAHVLPDVLKKFRAEFPEIKLQLMSRTLSQFLPMVLNGEVDLAIGPRSNQELSNKLIFLFWKSFSRMLLVPKDHPLHKKKSIKLTDLGAYPFILYKEGSETREAVGHAFAQHHLPYRVVMEIDGAENAKRYVELGIGISVVASLTVRREDRPRFWSVDVSHLFGKLDCGIYLRKTSYLTPAMKQFIRFFAPELSHKLRLH
jgi:DNA-binding transcriptional LysR family regulator